MFSFVRDVDILSMPKFVFTLHHRSGIFRRASGTAGLRPRGACVAVFGAVAVLIGGVVEDRLRGLGIALGVWLLLTVAWDGGVLWAAMAFQDYPLERAMLGLTFANPVDLARTLLVLRFDVAALEAWADEHSADPDDPSVVHDPRLRATVQAAVDRVNAGLSNPERVRRFALLHLPFDGDDLTPTLKLRRTAIAERHRDRLEALYQEA